VCVRVCACVCVEMSTRPSRRYVACSRACFLGSKTAIAVFDAPMSVTFVWLCV
jgi:hypothetical protein